MKKSRHVLLALACLLATVLLTVGCAFTGSQPSEDAPTTEPVPPMTDTKQPETEPATETEPASQETEETAPSDLLYSPADPGFTSGYRCVTVSDHVYYVAADGIYMMFEGQETLLYSGNFQRIPLCTDGKLLYAVDQAGNVLQLDLTDGSVKELFNVGPTADVLGASEDVLYIGRQEDENDWWGYDLCVYSLDGVLLEELGTDLDVSMVDGILCCTDFRSDVRTVPFRAYDREGRLVVEADEVWNFSVLNGAVYYFALEDGTTMEDFMNMEDCSTILYRADRNSWATEIMTFDGMPMATFCGDVLYMNGRFYSLENGAELTGGIYDKIMASGDSSSYRLLGKDDSGKWYISESASSSFFRENGSGEMVDCGKLPENTYFLSICGDWVYTLSNTEPTQVYASYLPVQ